MRNQKLLTMVQMALLTAIVVIFQLLGTFIKNPLPGGTSVSLVLVPIVIGSVLVGPWGGGFLGFVFGAITLWAGISGSDPFTALLFQNQPIATALICLGKGTLAGIAAGFVYRLISKKNKHVGSFLASVTVPVVNTGLFILGGLTVVSGTLQSNFVAQGASLLYFLVIVCAGVNFIAEFLLNLVVAPAVNTIVFAVQKRMGGREYR